VPRFQTRISHVEGGMPLDVARALLALTTGIYVLTTADGAEGHGMSSSWVTQVSGEPPLLAIAVGRGHRSHDLLANGGICALNVVGSASRHLEDYFYSEASRRPDNLAEVAHEWHATGVPVLSDVDTALICRVRTSHPAGDHTLFVVAVEDVILRGADRPLTSLDLEYVYVGTVVRR